MFRKQIFKNTLAQLTGRSVSAAAMFLSTVLLARALGSEYYGELVTVLAYLALFYVLVDFGANAVFLKTTQKEFANYMPRLFGARLLWTTLLAFVAMLGMMVLALGLKYYSFTVWVGVVIGMISLYGQSLFLSTGATFQMLLRFDRAALAQGLGASVATLLIAATFAWLTRHPAIGVWLGVFYVSLGSLVAAALGVWFMQKLGVSVGVKFDQRWLLTMFQQSLPLGTMLILNALYFRAGILLLSVYHPQSVVGAYGLAHKFFEFAIAAPTYFMASLYPRLLTEFKTWTRRRLMLKKILIGLALTGAVATLVVWVLSPFLGMIGSDFVPSVALLRLFALSLPLFFLTSPLMWLAVIAGKERQLALIYTLAVGVALGGGWWIIAQVGAVGAVFITILSELIVATAGWLVVYRSMYAKT